MALTRRESLQLLMAASAAAAAGGATSAKADVADIVVGCPNSLTGGFGDNGQMTCWGVQIAADMINSQGGIKSLGGAKLKVVVADSSSDNPAQATSVTERLLHQHPAVVIAGPTTRAMVLAAEVSVEKARVPMVASGYSDAIVERGMKYTFKITPKGSKLWNFGLDSTVEMMKAAGKPVKSIGIFCASDAVSAGVFKTLPVEAKRLNIPVSASALFQMGLTDPSVVVTPVRQHKPDLILLSAALPDTILVMQALRGLGITTPVLAAGAANSDAAGKALGKAAVGIVMPATYNWDIKEPINKKLVDQFHKAHGDVHYPPNGDYVGLGFIDLLILAQALEKAGSRDGTKIRDAMSSTTFTDLPVIGGKAKFDATGYNSIVQGLIGEWMSPDEIRTVWPKEYQTVAPKL
jgi:branched-chain amino acid transport system substrate-binding protein